MSKQKINRFVGSIGAFMVGQKNLKKTGSSSFPMQLE